MKSKGIIIELTALLDVILIMLFWVMMNISDSSDQVRQDAQAQVQEAQEEAAAAQDELTAAQARFEDELARLQEEALSPDKAARENQEALEGYSEGLIVTMNLRYDAVGKLFIMDQDGELGRTLIGTEEEIAAGMIASLEEAGLGQDDVILCALVYDGSRALYKDIQAITAAISRISSTYTRFYCTFINISR
ncbi:MAG: hypothetical protein IJ071_09775 [Ruminococcus sp.]|nr:hypothetical protein [Ruminococcus sp.]